MFLALALRIWQECVIVLNIRNRWFDPDCLIIFPGTAAADVPDPQRFRESSHQRSGTHV